MLLNMGSGSGYSLLWQLYKRVIPHTCPGRLHGLRVDGVNGCSVWSKALQRSHRAVTSLRLLENTPGWLARALLQFCLDGMCLHSFTTGLQVTQPNSSVASLCLSVSIALLSPSPAPHHHAKHSTLLKSAAQDQGLKTAWEVQLPYIWARFKHFSLSNHISALQNIIFTNTYGRVCLDLQPHQAMRASSIHSAPPLPSPLPIMVLWPLQGTALSVFRYRCLQLTLNSVLAFGDIHVHGSKIKTSFPKSIRTVSYMGFMLK